MKDIWTEEPTRIHQYAQPAAGSEQGSQREADDDAHESSTVIENRDSLLARVSASMAVPENASPARPGVDPFRLPGISRTPVLQDPVLDLPASRGGRRSSTAGVIQTFPFGHDDDNRSADLTPPPIQTRSRAERPATGDAHRTVQHRGGSRLGPHLPITIGIVASFALGMALNREPPRRQAAAPLPARAAAAAPLIQPRPAAPEMAPAVAVVPPRAMLKITSSPEGAYVAVDNEVGPGPTPREVDVGRDRWVTVTAQRPGFLPVSQTIFVQQATTEIEISLEADQSGRPIRRR